MKILQNLNNKFEIKKSTKIWLLFLLVFLAVWQSYLILANSLESLRADISYNESKIIYKQNKDLINTSSVVWSFVLSNDKIIKLFSDKLNKEVVFSYNSSASFYEKLSWTSDKFRYLRSINEMNLKVWDKINIIFKANEKTWRLIALEMVKIIQ